MLQTSARIALLVACGISIAGCSSSSSSGFGRSTDRIDPGLTTKSQIITLNADGSLPETGIDENASLTVSNMTNNGGFVYQIGRVAGTDEFLGVAGIAPNTRVGAAPTEASATYTGEYSLAYADRDEFSDAITGEITLDADFSTRRLTGQSGGLSVNGTITGQTLGGTASYRGVDADLTGRIGASRAVGAFAGHTKDAVLTGGFVANAN